jgi:hypothetical protein
MTDDAIDLDQHRGPAGKMGSEMRRHSARSSRRRRKPCVGVTRNSRPSFWRSPPRHGRRPPRRRSTSSAAMRPPRRPRTPAARNSSTGRSGTWPGSRSGKREGMTDRRLTRDTQHLHRRELALLNLDLI